MQPHVVPLDGRCHRPSVHTHLVGWCTYTAKISPLLLLRWLPLHLLLWLLCGHRWLLWLEGDCRVRLLLPSWHALLYARGVVVLLPLLLLRLMSHLEVILRVSTRSCVCCRVRLVPHALPGTSRAIVGFIPSVGPAIHPRLAHSVVVAAVVVVVAVTAVPAAAVVVFSIVSVSAVAVVVAVVVAAVVVVVVAVVCVHGLLLKLVDRLLLLL